MAGLLPGRIDGLCFWRPWQQSFSGQLPGNSTGKELSILCQRVISRCSASEAMQRTTMYDRPFASWPRHVKARRCFQGRLRASSPDLPPRRAGDGRRASLPPHLLGSRGGLPLFLCRTGRPSARFAQELSTAAGRRQWRAPRHCRLRIHSVIACFVGAQGNSI